MNWGDENLMEEELKIKSEIRKRIRTNIAENINILPLESKRVCEKILDSEEYKKADYIFAYMALNDEVDLSLLIQMALSENKTVAIPKINRENMTMNFFHYYNHISLEIYITLDYFYQNFTNSHISVFCSIIQTTSYMSKK